MLGRLDLQAHATPEIVPNDLAERQVDGELGWAGALTRARVRGLTQMSSRRPALATDLAVVGHWINGEPVAADGATADVTGTAMRCVKRAIELVSRKRPSPLGDSLTYE